MCGITGYSGRFEASLLSAMQCAIRHRGPDAVGELVIRDPEGARADVGLAHTRLSIIDLSPAGTQPMTVACSRCGVHASTLPAASMWLVFNGEIYNFRELRRELELVGHTFRTGTDSEVLLHLYAEHGAAMLEQLNGMFALALYDGRPRGQRGSVRPGDLLVARDGIGIKPLYYAETTPGFLFASELKALLHSRAVSRDLDLAALHAQLAHLWIPAPATPLTAVRKLRPGHAMLVRSGSVASEWCHYDLPYGGTQLQSSPADIAHDLAREIEGAVERQMVADVPVGAFLSGGLDSSAVVAMMRRVRPDYRPRCYTIGVGSARDTDGNPNDLPYARAVAAHLDVPLTEIEISPSIANRLPEMLFRLDEPQADIAPINALLIAERARDDGTKVLLSGAGGDDIFSGYRRHHALQIERSWSWLPGRVRAGIARRATRVADGVATYGRADGAGAAGAVRYHIVRRAAKALRYADHSQDERAVRYFWWSGEAMRHALYAPEFATSVRDVHTDAALIETLSRIPRERDPLNRLLYLEAKHFLADHNLNYTDKTAMAAGIEVRVPLLDQTLIDYAVRIPSRMKQRGAVGKAIFKAAMRPYLPRDVIYRAKTGFGAPLRDWLRHELRPIVDDVLSPTSVASRGLFDAGAVQSLVRRDRAGEIDGSYTVLALMCTELWLRMFVDSPVPAVL